LLQDGIAGETGMPKHSKDQILMRMVKLAALTTICGSLACADVLYWIDSEPFTSAIPGAITLAGFTGVAATSDTDFDTKLTTGTWDAVIIAIQGNPLSSFNPNILPDLTIYVNNGGRLIGTDWNPGDTSFYSLFDAAPVDLNNSSITNDGNALFNGIVGDISLTNPGFGIFDQSFSPLAGGTGFGPSGGGFGIIQGNSARTFLFGPLFDTYTALSQGEQLVANALNPSANPIPEPGTFALLLGAFGGLMLVRATKKQIS
jgi:hypothetical protein